MRLLVTGACGFAGSSIVEELKRLDSTLSILGFDNLSRAGSELNREKLRQAGVSVIHGDIRCASDLGSLPRCDFVLDCAANPSVLAGTTGFGASRQVVEHNLVGTLNLVEYCKSHDAGIVLLSTSRVYSVERLNGLPLDVVDGAFRLSEHARSIQGLEQLLVNENFATAAPISIYGACKLASEILLLEYGSTYRIPVWILRCGVLAGGGQFGRADQGIFSFWIHSRARKRPLKFFGFGGLGYQVRDCLHPRDLAPLILKMTKSRPKSDSSRVYNVGGGIASAMSLRQLDAWCDLRFDRSKTEESAEVRPFDVPWLVLDHEKATRAWDWAPRTPREAILDEIYRHAEANPGWLEITSAD